MPSVRGQHRTVRKVDAVSQGDIRRSPGAAHLPASTTCTGTENCTAPVVPDCPVTLCPQHLREAYQFAQGVIEDRLLIAAANLA